MEKASLEDTVLKFLDQNQTIPDSMKFAKEQGVDHSVIVGVLKSLASEDYVKLQDKPFMTYVVTETGKEYIEKGTPEKRIFDMIPSGGLDIKTLDAMKEVFTVAKLYGMPKKWFNIPKKDSPDFGKILRAVETAVDDDAQLFKDVAEGKVIPDKKLEEYLKKRKVFDAVKEVYFATEKGDEFNVTKIQKATDLTSDMLQSGSWKDENFKKYNFNALGKPVDTGNLHPLLKARQQFVQVLLELGFEEMPTNQYVESSFWNFDTLFQPQQHPARDAHDTFFVSDPQFAKKPDEAYWNRVKEVHEKGGYESIGWRYDWSEEEAKKNIFRTHTTGVSSKMLYALAQEKEFKPKKYFSIDRVFRNETLDATHLAEFHQFEGVVAERNIGLPELKALIGEFFAKIGIKDVKFKPTYNPYTEPSMEVYAYHPQLGKEVEIGNSGVFRPEMLRPMGLPEDVNVLGWGLSLERPTMINYKVANIRDLLGYKV
eukprot:CAMPEP_0114602638 /NCGR_PEP_ID=MMETSP0125-20121206/25209_1 /TAXON_ID=485358 ORGANISM="Aristerostoma sp., Strain ATCC 50986" /NCGR_SAMPLE_ID=MMETSP0125 /ASSEMBLY_ACC=CAM_ASM_000245 /LENGTH=482 /DNA_ID=CAMNT_0001812971 /DNA_START=41 /DNA_END=1490 /DNA_ORIENTATION=+